MRRPAGRLSQPRLPYWLVLPVSAILLACGASSLLPSCAEVEAADPFALEPGTPVVVVLIDTLRADRLSCYGYELETSPFLDELAARSYVFEANSTQCNSTFPSITSIFTGVYPKTHGNYLPVPIEGLATGGQNLLSGAQRFRAADYHTVAATSHPAWDAEPDQSAVLWRGWDQLSHIGEPIPIEERPLFARAEHTNERLFGLLDEYDRESTSYPLFLWAHYFDPHTDLWGNLYDPPEDLRNLYFDHHFEALGLEEYADVLRPMDPSARNEWIHYKGPKELKEELSLACGRAGYDAEIRSCDGGVRDLFLRLEESGVLEEAVIVIMSDHGENMEEYSDARQAHPFTHARLYDGVVHTPLIVHLPGQTRGARIGAITQNIDVLPTLLELTGQTLDAQLEGKSLVPLMRGTTDELHDLVFVESTVGRENAVRSEELKLIDGWLPNHQELYDWRNDPHELENLATGRLEERPAGLTTALEEFRPETSIGLRFAPMAEPYQIEIRAEMPGTRIDRVEGLPESTIHGEAHETFQWSGTIGPEGLEVSLFPQVFRGNQDVSWTLRHTGRDDLHEAVWFGRTPVSRTPVIPLWATAARYAPEEPAYVISEDLQAGTARVEVEQPGAGTIQCEVRYSLPRFDKTFVALESEGFAERFPPSPHVYRADAEAVGRASLELSLTAPKTPRHYLLRIDGAWAAPEELLINQRGVDTRILHLLIPGLPPDLRIQAYLNVSPPPLAELPPGTVAIWQSSGGGGEIDGGSLSPGLARQLSAIGYLGESDEESAEE